MKTSRFLTTLAGALFLSAAISVTTSIAGAQTAHAFEVKTAPKTAQRINPAQNPSAIYSFNGSIEQATRSVVNISTEKKTQNPMRGHPMFDDPFFRQFFGDIWGHIPKDRIDKSLGSGVIIGTEGYIITNHHVIDGADKIIVNLHNDRAEHVAKLVASDERSDLAVIKIDKKGLPAIAFGASSDVLIGDIVFAIGNPFGVGESVTQGIVSATDKSGIGINEYENFIQTDASINPGNSGGALIDSRGFLIGINTAILSSTGGNHGIGFAIPSDMVAKIAKQLIEKGKISRGYLGVGIQDITNDLKGSYGGREGAILISIEKNSAAEKAGLLVWDLVTELNGKPIRSASELKNAIGLLEPNDVVEIKFIREGKEKSAKITLNALPGKGADAGSGADSSDVIKGAKLAEITPALRQKYGLPSEMSGVLIESLEQKSEAYAAGMRAGEVIAQVENAKIASLADLKSALNRFKNKQKRILLYTDRGSKMILFK